jgi:hypothetical protein
MRVSGREGDSAAAPAAAVPVPAEDLALMTKRMIAMSATPPTMMPMRAGVERPDDSVVGAGVGAGVPSVTDAAPRVWSSDVVRLLAVARAALTAVMLTEPEEGASRMMRTSPVAALTWPTVICELG